MGNRLWKSTITALIFVTGMYCLAQTPDVFRAEYMIMPENGLGGKLSRMKLVANLPIALKDSSNIIIGAEYNRFAYGLEREGIPEGVNDLRQLHVIDLNLAYVYKYDQYWKVIGLVTPRLASTFDGRVEKEDLFFNATVGVLREKKKIAKPSILVLGVAYNSTVPQRIPLPIVYYERRFHESWSYVVGVPKTAMKYHFNEKHQLQSEFIFDGYYINLQNSIFVPGGGSASSISSSASLLTFGYQYAIKKPIFLYFYGGHTLFQNGVLRDTERKDIFNLNDGPSLYFRTGFRIGL